MEPSEKSFDSPTSSVAAQRASILRRGAALSAMRCDHLDTVAFGQISVQTVAVVGFVADQSRREAVEEAVPEDAFDELAFVRRSAFDTNGERKTVSISESDDLRSLAAFGGPDRKAPFFAPVKEASIKASSRSSFPRACNSSASTRKMRSSLAARTHCWKRRWQVW
jgi:hypothetical protein